MRPPRASGSDSQSGRAGGAKTVLGVALTGVSVLFVLAYRRVLGVTQRPSWPPPGDAVTPAGAQYRAA